MSAPREQGTIARLVEMKGFGFIRGEDGAERFFHRSEVMNSTFDLLREGQAVTFEPTATEKGPRAQRVQIV